MMKCPLVEKTGAPGRNHRPTTSNQRNLHTYDPCQVPDHSGEGVKGRPYTMATVPRGCTGVSQVLYGWFPGAVQVVPGAVQVVPWRCTGGSLVLYRWFPGAVQVVPWCCTGGSLVQ